MGSCTWGWGVERCGGRCVGGVVCGELCVGVGMWRGVGEVCGGVVWAVVLVGGMWGVVYIRTCRNDCWYSEFLHQHHPHILPTTPHPHHYWTYLIVHLAAQHLTLGTIEQVV